MGQARRLPLVWFFWAGAAVAWAFATAGVLRAEAGLELEMRAAWAGVVPLGSVTEIEISLASGSGGRVDIAVSGPGPAALASVELAPGEPRRIALPVLVETLAPATARVNANGVTLAEVAQDLFRPSAQRRVVAFAANGQIAPAPALAVAEILPVSPGELPRTVQAYDAVTAVGIDQAALARLDAAQIAALEGHLRRCGRVLFIGADGRMQEGLRRIAGCGGGFLAVAPALDTAARALGSLLEADARALPSAREVAMLARPDAGASGSFALGFLGVYFAAMAALIAAGPGWSLIAAPLLAVAVAMAAWWGAAPSVAAVGWMEAVAGDATGRYVAVFRIDGQGRGSVSAELPATASIAAPLPAGLELRRVYAADGVTTVIEAPATLLSRQSFLFEDTDAVPAAVGGFSASSSAIRNDGEQPTVAAVMAWRGKLQEVPELAPGDAWRWREPAAPPSEAYAHRLLLKRSGDGDPALLVRRAPGVLERAVGSEAHGWLRVVAGGGEAGE